MSMINGVSSLYADKAAATTSSSSSTSSSTSSTDVTTNEFLQLLIAQLQNQDPLSPMDNSQFVTQLATFNSLEQLMSINKAVTTLADASSNSSTSSNSSASSSTS